MGGENHLPTGILEINPRHPFVVKPLESLPEDEDGEEEESVKDNAWILFDMATMSGGFPIRDPKKYAARMTRVLKTNLDVDSLTLADEIDPPEEEDEPDEPDFDMPDMDGFDMGDFNMESLEDLDM